jgi:hypothetical protein
MGIFEKFKKSFASVNTEKPVDTLDQYKKQKDLDKIELEIKLLKKNLANYTKAQKLEVVRIILTFLTTIIAFGGIYFAYRSQQKQLDTLTIQHLDDGYSKKAELLVSATNEETKLAAISNLSIYLQPNYDSTLQDRTINLLILYAEADTLLAVKENIVDNLLENAPAKTLIALLNQNRFLNQTFQEYYRGDMFDPADWSKALDRKLLNLDWNVTMISKCLKKIKTVHDLNLANIAFEVPSSLMEELDKISHQERDLITITANFENVNLTNTYLNEVQVSRCNFKKVQFDSSFLNRTKFRSCKFDDCSFKNIQWDFLADDAETYSSHPNWQDCSIKAKIFSVYFDSSSVSKMVSDKDLFFNSDWKFLRIENNLRAHITKEGNNRQLPINKE